jgi:hypothetical protein
MANAATVSPIFMKPWIGTAYDCASDQRILIVGESAYDDPTNNYYVNSNTNIDIISEEVEGTPARTHKSQKQIAKIVSGTSEPNYAEFWNSVAFYNFVQIGLPDRKDRSRIREALPRSKAAFSELVGLSGQSFIYPKPRPTHIIAVGTSITWEKMPACEYDAREWAYALQGYKYPDGTIGLATAIVHPGCPRKYPLEKMSERVRLFLQLKPDDRSVQDLLSSESASFFR